jgi:hypothetical protein
MKKYWKFLLVWLLLLTYFNVNYICYRGDYLSIPYSAFVAKYWILENVILIIVGVFYFLLKKSLKVQTLWGRVFNSKLREFFKFNRIKVLMTLGIVFGSFIIGFLLTLIKSNNHEEVLSMIFYGLAPEYVLSTWPFMSWIDIAFGLQTLFITLGKWFIIYCVAAFIFKKKYSVSPVEVSHE